MVGNNDKKYKEKYKVNLLSWLLYWNTQEKKLKEDAKEMVENFNKEIKKHEEEQKKLKMMHEHPEWFETTSPKEFGIKKLEKKKR